MALDLAYCLNDQNKIDLVHEVFAAFDRHVRSREGSLRRGLIHGDLNEQNLLAEWVPDAESYKICGILDYGDAHISCIIYDIALPIMYMMLDSDEKHMEMLTVGKYILRGYQELESIPEDEYSLLKLCICARYCQSLVIGFYTYSTNPKPENAYVLTTQKKGWEQLNAIWNTPEDLLYKHWKSVNE